MKSTKYVFRQNFKITCIFICISNMAVLFPVANARLLLRNFIYKSLSICFTYLTEVLSVYCLSNAKCLNLCTNVGVMTF